MRRYSAGEHRPLSRCFPHSDLSPLQFDHRQHWAGFRPPTGCSRPMAGFCQRQCGAANRGPNAISYLLAGEVFPTDVRGKGAGFAASFAKLGAVAAAFLFPIFLHTIGTSMLLFTLAGTSFLGAVFTWNFAIETKGLNPESLGSGAEPISPP
jgi:sugar phosphate permease